MEDFKSRVVKVSTETAKQYNDYFVKYEYLICSQAFSKNKYYILAAHQTNFLHLTGVKTALSAADFFDKCLEDTLTATDFSICREGQTEKEAKGTIRRKIKALPKIFDIFSEKTIVEEDFSKNNIHCSFVAGDKTYTLGFSLGKKVKPQTLLDGNFVKSEKAAKLDLVLRKEKSKELFDEIVYGDITCAASYNITEFIDKKLTEK